MGLKGEPGQAVPSISSSLQGTVNHRHHVSLTYKGGVTFPVKSGTRSYSWWDSPPCTGTPLAEVSAARREPSAPSAGRNGLP